MGRRYDENPNNAWSRDLRTDRGKVIARRSRGRKVVSFEDFVANSRRSLSCWQSGQGNDECIPSLLFFFHLFSPARRRSKAWKRRPHRPIERFHTSPVGAAKMSRRPAIVCYARIVDFLFSPVLFPWPGGLRCSFPTHPRFFPFPRLHSALLFRRQTGWWRRVAPSAHFLPINLAACGNGRHADDRDSSR